MNPPTDTPERLSGYALVREAGRGAMSTVYEARDGKNQRVALKVLHAPATLAAEQQKALVDRLEREARAMLRLSHPNVVRIFDVGQEAGEHFIVMEYLEGQTLRARLDSGPLSLAEASRLLDQIASALDAVHAEGIVHRDVKPSNIMLTEGGRVKLMDFGVARQGDDTTITQTGMIVGSPAYMSPEQVRGQENTSSTDLWALGILLYEMLAGHSPFTGSNVSTVLYRVAHEAPAPVPGMSGTVQQILRRALDKNPAKRYRTGRDLADAFRAAALGPAFRSDAASRRPQRWAIIALPVAAMLALLVGAVFWTRSQNQSASPTLPPSSSHSSVARMHPVGTARKPMLPAAGHAARTPETEAAATIKEVTPTTAPTPGLKTPAAKLGVEAPKPSHRTAPKRRTNGSVSRPRRSRQTQAIARSRRRGRRLRRVIYGRRAYPPQRQRWQTIDRFIYHDYY